MLAQTPLPFPVPTTQPELTGTWADPWVVALGAAGTFIAILVACLAAAAIYIPQILKPIRETIAELRGKMEKVESKAETAKDKAVEAEVKAAQVVTKVEENEKRLDRHGAKIDQLQVLNPYLPNPPAE